METNPLDAPGTGVFVGGHLQTLQYIYLQKTLPGFSQIKKDSKRGFFCFH